MAMTTTVDVLAINTQWRSVILGLTTGFSQINPCLSVPSERFIKSSGIQAPLVLAVLNQNEGVLPGEGGKIGNQRNYGPKYIWSISKAYDTYRNLGKQIPVILYYYCRVVSLSGSYFSADIAPQLRGRNTRNRNVQWIVNGTDLNWIFIRSEVDGSV